MTAPVLWHLEISHYNEKACWALDYKGIPHVRRPVTPGFQQLTARRLRAGRTVPILEVDGRRIGDSTRIIAELERRSPQPPLYPADPQERRRALALEDFFDEQVGPHARRVLFGDTLTDPGAFVAMFTGRRPPAVLDPLGPLLAGIVRRAFEVWPATVEESRATVRAAFDRVAEEAGPSGYLAGASFSVADLTAASMLGLIVVPPEFPYVKLHPDERTAAFRRFRDSLRGHPAFAWVEAMYARHRGTSAEVAIA